MTTPIIPLIRCTKCGEEKPATPEYFNRNKNRSSGVSGDCRVCRQEYMKLRYQRDKERFGKISAEWRKNHPEKMREYQAKYVANNGERVAESKRQYTATHIPQLREKTIRYRAENPDRYQAHLAITRAVLAKRIPKVKTQECVQCGKQAGHYHHWSYLLEHQLMVVPLCYKCHHALHVED